MEEGILGRAVGGTRGVFSMVGGFCGGVGMQGDVEDDEGVGVLGSLGYWNLDGA